MQPLRTIGLVLAGSFALAAPVLAQPADASTTVIEQHHVVRAPAVQPAPTVIQQRTTVSRSISASASGERTGPPARPARHRVLHHLRRTHPGVTNRTVVATDRTIAVPAPPAPGAPVATIDRKTVIHRNEDGDVVRHTKVVRQDADGNRTSVERRTVTDADAPPPPPPASSPN